MNKHKNTLKTVVVIRRRLNPMPTLIDNKKTKNTDDSGAATSRKKLRIDVAPEESKPVDHSVALAIARDENKCIYCFGITNRQGHSEQLLVCKDCNARVHPSCADMTEELATRASSCPWQCIDCKTCNVCNDSGDAEDMLICDSCDKGFHMNCHNPTVPEKPTGKWVCCQCVIEQGENNTLEESKTDVASDERKEAASGNDLAELTCLPTPGASPVHVQTENTQNEATSSKTSTVRPPARVLPKLSDTLIGEPPDASDWSPVDVAAFFHNLGFTEESSAFQNQEIDGKALLLMTRNDVLTGLEFKLGPALKIYAHIQRLQTRDHWLTVHK